jgi:ketol-acid reductoisomerase
MLPKVAVVTEEVNKPKAAHRVMQSDVLRDSTVGQPFFKATWRRNDEHQIETVGEKLRALMPWTSKGNMVDRARN